jgi:serine/threonine protein kinase/Tol biopolymer transport system component
MKPERWQEASRILESVLERDPDHRAAYLDEVCADDDGLRREVESLLAASEQAGSLLDSPAMEMAAPLFVNNSVESMRGQSVGRYKIINALGSGGMGEVYLAHDTRLGRKIALKLLPARFTTDRDRLRRFEQEAHTASTLSHPNVCVIHEVGEAENGRHYIAMEYVEGVTLRQRVAGARLEPTEALDVAIQVASALAAAHALGIVHRDIKPENIMVRSDSIIKVLDFGLAKLTQQPQPIDSELATRALVQTDTGLVMGTTAYMSPEQARGLPVDARTDIWSLGVVLYEMLAGRPPFEGESASDLIAAILKTEPPAFSYYAAEVPSELEQVARRALHKERETRHQTAGDLLNDLKDIKQELEFQSKLERAAQPEARHRVKAARRSWQAELQTAHVEAVQTDDGSASTTSSAEYVISQINRHKTGVFITLVLFVVCVGLAYAIYHFAVRTKPSVAHFQNMKIMRLTNEGNVGNAAISPDGKYLAYSVSEDGKLSIWTKHLATDSQTQIVPPVEVGGLNPNTFTHDGGYIYYTRHDQQNPQGTLYQVPVLGGASKKILTNIAFPISLSPDGRQIAFGRYYADSNEDELLVANADGTNERSLLRPKTLWLSEAAATWSPDGKVLAVGYGQRDVGDRMVVALVSVADGRVKLMPTPRWFHIGQIAWFNEGSGLVLQVQEQEFGKLQIWQLSYPGGEARRITNDLSSYNGNLTLTASGNALVTVQDEMTSRIWIAVGGKASSAREVTSRKNGQDGLGGLMWSPDGRVIYGNNIEGKKNVWIMNADGSAAKPLTDSTADSYSSLPEVTSDGRYVVFISTRTGQWQLWRTDIDGNNPKQLSEERDGAGSFCISPDGQWVIYSPFPSGISKVSINGGTPTKLIDKPGGYTQISPDGRLLAYYFVGKITVTTFDGGAPIKTFGMPGTSGPLFYFSHDGHALIYINTQNGVSNLWSQPLDGEAPKQITNFKSDLIYRFAYSRDGKQLVLARGNVSRDAVMISESK